VQEAERVEFDPLFHKRAVHHPVDVRASKGRFLNMDFPHQQVVKPHLK
jgi:hypothetical protein